MNLLLTIDDMTMFVNLYGATICLERDLFRVLYGPSMGSVSVPFFITAWERDGIIPLLDLPIFLLIEWQQTVLCLVQKLKFGTFYQFLTCNFHGMHHGLNTLLNFMWRQWYWKGTIFDFDSSLDHRFLKLWHWTLGLSFFLAMLLFELSDSPCHLFLCGSYGIGIISVFLHAYLKEIKIYLNCKRTKRSESDGRLGSRSCIWDSDCSRAYNLRPSIPDLFARPRPVSPHSHPLPLTQR